MFFTPHRLPVSWLGVCIALAGAVYCGLQAAPLPVSIPCPGTGCHLFQDFTVHGISLWWAGVAYFALMAVLCVRRATTACLFLATLALILDAVLLIIMLGTAACIACLGGALLIGLLFLSIRRHAFNKTIPGPGVSIVFMAWAGLFIAAGAAAGAELISPWRMHGPENAERRVYFSPSCPACRDAITVFAGTAAFMPVVERDSDYAAIYRMQKAVDQGKTMADALAEAEKGTDDEPLSLHALIMRFKLLRNKAEILRLGFDRLPLIMTAGMPRSLRPGQNTTSVPDHAYPSGSAALPPELSGVDSCGGASQEPCETPLGPGY